MEKINGISFHRIKHDSNGNPRYVFHFLSIVNEKDEAEAKERAELPGSKMFFTQHLFTIAHRKAKQIGASKYRGKDFGGGFVVQSYNLEKTSESILSLKNS